MRKGVKEIITQLIERVLGNDKIVIIFAITFLCAYAIFQLPDELAARLSDTALGGLLGMAIGQKLGPEAPK